jgi:hypothetical protein
MWWLSFVDGRVVILDAEASSLIHARTIAAMHGLGRVSHFEGGHFINPEHAALISGDLIGRMLSPFEVQQLRERLGYTRREPED